MVTVYLPIQRDHPLTVGTHRLVPTSAIEEHFIHIEEHTEALIELVISTGTRIMVQGIFIQTMTDIHIETMMEFLLMTEIHTDILPETHSATGIEIHAKTIPVEETHTNILTEARTNTMRETHTNATEEAIREKSPHTQQFAT